MGRAHGTTPTWALLRFSHVRNRGLFRRLKEAVAPRPVLDRMTDAVRHRGPDDAGLYLDGRVGLGHARLSIIDLSGGQQPMANADGTVWVSFNGEIFNYVELREELIARGHRFAHHSDTEVIVAGLSRRCGADCVEAFNGDFAFALWDAGSSRLMLARDRMGVRPLFYTLARRRLYFASEVKALLEVPGRRAPSSTRSRSTRSSRFWFPLAPRTPFKDIYELPPGARADRRARTASTVRPYWRLDYPDAARRRAPTRAARPRSPRSCASCCSSATRIRLRADVPVGAYLSGGLDSSIIAALASKQHRPSACAPSRSTFEIAEFDESAFQQEMVRALGTEHASRRLHRAPTSAARFPSVIRHTERPILRTAPAPLYAALASSCTSSGFKVVLTGEGADEVFGGYDIFKEAKVRRFCGAPAALELAPALLRRLYPYLPRCRRSRSTISQAFFGTGLDAPSDPLFSHLPRFRTTRRRQGCSSRPTCATRSRATTRIAGSARRACRPSSAAGIRLSQAQYLETALPAARLHPVLAGRPRGDGARRRGPLPVPRPPRGRVRRADPAAPEAAAACARSTSCGRRGAPPACRDIGERPSSPTARPTASAFVGPGAPDYVDELLSPQADRRGGGLFRSARGASSSLAKCRPAVRSASATTWPLSACCRRSSGTASSSHARRSRLALPRGIRSTCSRLNARTDRQSRSLTSCNTTHARSASSSRTTFCSARTATALSDNESLLDAGLIDSTGVLELVAFLESRVRHRSRRRRDRARRTSIRSRHRALRRDAS